MRPHPARSPTTSAPLTLVDLDDLGVQVLRGVGDDRARALSELGISSVLDLLWHYPRRYVDRTREARVADLVAGAECLVMATVTAVSQRRTRNRRSLVELEVADATGGMRVVFFNQAWRARQLVEGTEVALFGAVETYRGRSQLTNPVVDLVGDQTGRIVAVYPQSDKAGITSAEVARLVAEALRRTRRRGIADPVPRGVRSRFGLIDRQAAMAAIHAPEAGSQVRLARDRLVFDELLRLQVVLVRAKRQVQRSGEAITHQVTGPVVDAFLGGLRYELTGAQRRAIEAIHTDLARPVPMNRLLQGDVGSGKTLVAVAAMVAAVQGGHQAALLAPTEVLAEQHSVAVADLLGDLEVDDPMRLGGRRPVGVRVLTGRLGTAERRQVHAGLVDGSVDVVIGTQALLGERVTFSSLGVVVVDEQHRFGVEQRDELRRRPRAQGRCVPDLLVMTATPIPRTAAMTVYGDLDVTVLDELPPGRRPVTTRWARTPAEESGVWEDVRAEVAAGHQAYVVCSLIDEGAQKEGRAAATVHAELSETVLAGLRVGLLHGRLAARDKELTMAAFRAGELDVLVSTTVIEVGVDVAAATVMVVLDADRFGLAQLHQLRGRVGRGSAPSRCHLLGAPSTPDGQRRLEALEASTDGFALAEVDLDLRGEGTLLRSRQSGRNDLRLASLRCDEQWVHRARDAAERLVGDDPELASHPVLSAELDRVLPPAADEHLGRG